MNDSRTTRRRFLAASLALSTVAVSGAAWLRGAAAWAGSPSNATLARFGRLLFPHDGLPDKVYAEVMGKVLTALAGSPASTDLLSVAEQALNRQQDKAWFDLDEPAQIKAIETIQGEAWFAAILSTLRDAFYDDAAVWAYMNYPGSSKEFGGYLHRGFDDIDWLPASKR